MSRSDEEVAAEIAANTRAYSRDERTEFYRQPGGCLEIHQFDVPPRLQWDEQSIVHVCEDEIPQFLAELNAFIAETPADPSRVRSGPFPG